MKYLKQFSIILFLSFLGELIHYLVPLPVPASVYGLVLMLAALGTGVLKVHQVKETSKFLIDIMPVMFIPAGVGLIASWDTLRPVAVPVLVITFLTTVIVMAAAGLVTQAVIRSGRRKNR